MLLASKGRGVVCSIQDTDLAPKHINLLWHHPGFGQQLKNQSVVNAMNIPEQLKQKVNFGEINMFTELVHKQGIIMSSVWVSHVH